MWHVWETRESHTGFLVGRPEGERERERSLARPRRRWNIIKLIFKKWNGEAWIALIWLRIGTGGGRL
jgi:hypothetical protein